MLPILILISLFSVNSSSKNGFEANSRISKLEYQIASMFTHLKWSQAHSKPVKIKILPIKNFSGIPMELRKEKSDYFNHGKIPLSANQLFSDLVNASRYLSSTDANSDYQLQLSINRYQLPHDYAPDDLWWKELQDDVDRWLVTPNHSHVSLTLEVISHQHVTTTWSHTIGISLSNCDINSQSQPLITLNNDPTIRGFVETAPGQAFIAASNFLILQSIYHISRKDGFARVASKSENELLLLSDNQSFSPGEELALFQNNRYPTPSSLPIGRVQIIKTYQNQAVAYPINLRADQIKPGDWVEMKSSIPYPEPKSIFIPKNTCAQVSVAEL